MHDPGNGSQVGRAPRKPPRRDQYFGRGQTLTTTAWLRAPLDDHPDGEMVLRREVAQLGA
jgi:hypothetical protein